MKTTIYLFILLCSPLLAWNPPIKEESKLKYAVWAGHGIISEKRFVIETGDAYLWKAIITVKDTLKGEESDKIEFYFEQGQGLDKAKMIFRCPDFPRVVDGNLVKLFLHKRSLEGVDVFFLNGDQMIEKTPNQSPETTTMAVTPAASHPSRQP